MQPVRATPASLPGMATAPGSHAASPPASSAAREYGHENYRRNEVAASIWPAKTARDLLKITWDDSKAETRSTEQLLSEFRALSKTAGQLVKQNGDFDAALAKGGRVVEAEYVFPYLAHAPMEPLNGFIRWEGETASARFGSQFPTPDHAVIAQVLGIGIDKVHLQTILAGGSFGRRAQQTTHVAFELAQVAKAIGPGKAIKLVWTREDDMRGGYYRPFGVHRMRGVVRDGKIEAWSDTIVGQSIMKGSPFEAMTMKDGMDSTAYEGSNEIPYQIANFKCDLHQVEVGVPVLWWRSVGHTHTGYAVEAFVDELLEAAGQDPVEGPAQADGQQVAASRRRAQGGGGTRRLEKCQA